MTKKISKRVTVSCGIVLVQLSKPTKFLMLRAYDYWDFPKGKIEPGESYIEAAIREVEEETTIHLKNLDFKWGFISKDTELYKKGTKYAKYFIAECNTDKVSLPISKELGKPENDEYRWVTYRQGKKLSKERIGKILKWAHQIVQ